MNKRMVALCLSIITLMTTFSSFICNVSAEEDNRAVAEAAYGKPIIDGVVDSIWESTSYNIMNIEKYGDKNFYSGWFKVLWDDENLYVLAKVYGTHFDNSDTMPWNNDSFEIFVDEDCARTTKYDNDDYQIRADYFGATSGQNYDIEKVKAASVLEDNYYYTEMAVPFKTIKGEAGKKLGFDVQVNTSATFIMDRVCYGWSESSRTGSPSSNTSLFGDLVLKKEVQNTSITEPEYQKPILDGGYNEPDEVTEYKKMNDIITRFDEEEYNIPIILANDYPMISVRNLATAINGSIENDNTLIKDNVRITYTAGERLAIYGNGHLMLERTPFMSDGELYVPVSSVVPTLCYHLEFLRFNEPPVLEITTGTNYPEPTNIMYVKDFGAIGDGLHDDKEAILKAVNAAVMSGVPTRLIFQENAIYRMSERTDRGCILDIRQVKNLELEGNGCTFLIEKPINMFLNLWEGENVKIKNMSVKWEEHTSTQGRIEKVDKEEKRIYVRLDEGFPEIPPEEWRKANGYGYYFAMLYHPTENRPKITEFDNTPIDNGIIDLGNRLYSIPIPSAHYTVLDCYEEGDRIVIPSRASNYDGKGTTSNHMDFASASITIRGCKNIVLDGVTSYGSTQLGMSIGMCTGRIFIRNYKMLTKEGALLANNSDGIHYWRNRAGLVLENSVLSSNLDDHINTKSEDAQVLDVIDNRTFVIDYNTNCRVGDEMVFYDTVEKRIVGRGFLKANTYSNGEYKIELDRDVEGAQGKRSHRVSQATRVYCLESTGEGTVIRNNIFSNSRRHIYITRSQNSIFENNKIYNNGGSMVAAMNEVTNDVCEGFVPSSLTVRNNYVEGKDGNTTGYYPIEVCSFKSNIKSQSIIDGVLIEDNTINVNNKKHAILIKDTMNLYLLNNKVIYDRPLEKNTLPVAIVNTEVEKIDGMTFDADNNEKPFITFAASRFDEADIKNIVVPSGSEQQKYVVEE